MIWAMALILAAGIAVVVMGFWIESQGTMLIPGLGSTVVSLILFTTIGIAMYAVIRSLVKDRVTDRDYIHVDWVLPDQYVEVYSADGDTRKHIDRDDLDEYEWMEIADEPVFIDIPDDVVTKILNLENNDVTNPAELGILNKSELDAAIALYLPDSVKQKHENLQAGKSERDKTNAGDAADPQPGRRFYFYYVVFGKPRFYTERNSIRNKTSPRAVHDGIWILPAPWNQSFEFRPLGVRAMGFDVQHSHAERIEIVMLQTVLSDLTINIVSTCTFHRKNMIAQASIAPGQLAVGLIKTITYFYNRVRSSVAPLEELIDQQNADDDEYSNTVKRARIEVLARLNARGWVLTRDKQLNRDKQNADGTRGLKMLAGLLGGLVCVLFFMRLYGV